MDGRCYFNGRKYRRIIDSIDVDNSGLNIGNGIPVRHRERHCSGAGYRVVAKIFIGD